MARTTEKPPVSLASFARKDFSTPATVTVSHEFRSEHPWLRQQQRMSRSKTTGATGCVHGLSTGYHSAVAALLGTVDKRREHRLVIADKRRQCGGVVRIKQLHHQKSVSLLQQREVIQERLIVTWPACL